MPGNPPEISGILRMMSRGVLYWLLWALWPWSPGSAQAGPGMFPIDTARARAYAREADALVARDHGSLWGRSLAGPLLFVHPASRALLAEQPDAEQQLVPFGGWYRGVLPPSENAANAPIRWAGRSWSMLQWPLPSDSVARGVLLVHELWHRVQDSLGLPGRDPPNPQLATRDGRLWLRLEARALARALGAAGPGRSRALRDALLFREARRRRFPGADSTERALELNEGLAEYSGVVLAAPDSAALTALAVERLASLDTLTNYERSFAYHTGPAYGLLLDALVPDWRGSLPSGADLGALLAARVRFAPEARTSALIARGNSYGYAVVRRQELARERARGAHLAALRGRFVKGPLLELPLAEMKLGFDPGKVEAFESLGTIYGSLRLSDRWGVLQSDVSGGLISADWRRLIVPAPADTTGRRLVGPGWVLELAPGWRIVAGSRAGDWTVVAEPGPAPPA